jgi:hypothetical protein
MNYLKRKQNVQKLPALLWLLILALLAACDSGETNPYGIDTHWDDSEKDTQDTQKYEEARQACVNKINAFRATIGAPPLSRWLDKEACADHGALLASKSGNPHSAFGMCDEFAQNTCPGWPSIDAVNTTCLEMMWDEGPGQDFSKHGHYLNMSEESYTMVACGFAESSSGVWAVQNFR